MTIEQRNSYRCQSIDERQKAVLKIAGREVVTELVDQSAGGFSVATSKKLRVREGKVLLVRTSAGWFQAQVIHNQRSEGKTTLGMVRLADLPDPRDAQLVKPGGRKLERTGGNTTSTGVFLVVAIVATLGFWVFMGNFAWFGGHNAGSGRRVDMGAYFSELVESMITRSPSPSASSSSDGASMPVAE